MMQTRFLTSVTARCNPFSLKAKPIRLFLSLLPPDARQSGIKVSQTILPRGSVEKPLLELKFRDGKEMKLDAGRLGISGIMEEVDRHSRGLARKEELSG